MNKITNNLLYRWAKFKAFYKQNGTWFTIPIIGIDDKATNAGVKINRISRRAFPSYGEASFEALIGNVNGVNTNITKDGQTITALDLKGKEVIVLAGMPNDIGDITYSMVFWGVCDYQLDRLKPAGFERTLGKRVYQCVDIIYSKLKKCKMNRHSYKQGTTTYFNCEGVPCYNGVMGRDDLFGGNKSTSSETYGGIELPYFTFSSKGDYWSDQAVIYHAIHTGQKDNDDFLHIAVNDTTLSLGFTSHVWRPKESQSVWEFIAPMLKFTRGFGVAFFDWTTTGTGEDIRPENAKITIKPLKKEDTEVSLWDKAKTLFTETFLGADENVKEITLTGDERVVDNSFLLGGLSDFTYDRVELYGEKMQVTCTLDNYINSVDEQNLEPLWQEDDDESPLVNRLYGLSREFTGKVINNAGGDDWLLNYNSIDFRCDDDGKLENVPDVALNPAMIKTMPNTNFFFNIDPLTNLPIKGTSANTKGMSSPIRLMKYDIDNLSGDVADSYANISHQIRQDGVFIGTERSTTTVSSTDFAITTALQINTRVSVASGMAKGLADTVKRIYVQGRHLWMAMQGTVWQLEPTVEKIDTDALDDNFVVMKDDRNEMRRMIANYANWYVTPHQTVKWTVRDMAFRDSFETVDGDISYPQIGDFITKIYASNMEHEVNVPITSVIYDNREGKTSFVGDWGELEL